MNGAKSMRSMFSVSDVSAANAVIPPLRTAVDPAIVECAAEAAYHACMQMPKDHGRYEPWQSLPDYWKRTFRVQAAAVIQAIS